MSVSATQIQFLRSSILNFRPDPAQLLDGQPAVNINAAQPGLFFKDNNGYMFKVGPASVGPVAPNNNAAGTTGNSVGELWFDTNKQELTVWDGIEWRPADPSELSFSRVVIQPSAPDLNLYPNGALWWNDGNGQMYVLYEDPNGRQWIQVGAGGGGGAGAVVISEQQPDPVNTSAGTLWWNDETGSLFVLYNDGGPEKLWIQIAGSGAINGGQGGSVTAIQAGTGLVTNNGQPITTQGTILLRPATTTEIGGVKPGNNVTIDADGTINFNGAGSGTVTQIATGPGITGGPITSTGTIGLAAATDVQIGGVKPGVGTAITSDGTLFMTPANEGQLGGVIVGEGLSVSAGGVVSVDVVPPGSVPSGLVQWFAGNLSTIPTGWLYANGSALLVSAFPSLYAAIGRIYSSSQLPPDQFQLPDLRGQFLRGWDDRTSGGLDNNRVLGSVQNDQNLQHTHSFRSSTVGYLAAYGSGREVMALPTSQQDTQKSNGIVTVNNPDANVVNTTPNLSDGGSEARPKNVALLPIIKV